MANQLSNNPWLLDVVSATPCKTGWLTIRQFELINYVNDTDVAILKDALGNIVWQANGASDLSTVRSGPVGSIFGLALTTLVNGQVLVYFQ